MQGRYGTRAAGEPAAPDAGMLSRRELLKRGVAGAAGLTLLPTVLAACSNVATATPPPGVPTPTPAPTSATPSPSGALTLAILSNSGGGRRAGLSAIVDAFRVANPALDVEVTFIDPLAQNATLAGYLGFRPADVVYLPYAFRRYAERGLLSPLDDVWSRVGGGFGPGIARAMRGPDGRVYGLPLDFSVWGMFYRKSVWAERGYVIPQTWDQLLALGDRMKVDRLTPIAFGDLDGFPAFGFFDMIDLRLNGYDFHTRLLNGDPKWTDRRVLAVFETWRQLIPYCGDDVIGRRWQAAFGDLLAKKAAMTWIDLAAVTDEISQVDASALADLDFFEFPFFGNEFDVERTVEARINAWTRSTKSQGAADDLRNAGAFLEFVARGSTQLLYHGHVPSSTPVAKDTDRSTLGALASKAIALVNAAPSVTQFLDRDTRPEFAGPNGMQNFLYRFLSHPEQDLATLTKQIQAFWDGLPPAA